MELYLWLAIPVVLFTAWFYTASVVQSRFPTLRNKAIVLLVAHPDDEAMFFAPTVLALTRRDLGNHLKILCLSSGNAENIGSTRKHEIVASAQILGLQSESDLLVYEDSAFPDSMTEHWSPTKIATVLSSFFTKASTKPGRKQATSSSSDAPTASIDVLVTFDRGGVSGHPNHSSLYHGSVAWLRNLMQGKAGWECPVTLYTLSSTNVVRKYMGIFDAPLTMITSVLDSMQAAGKRGEKEVPRRLMFLSDLSLYRKAQVAMTDAHKSQMVWFRWGWISLSRYMVVNDLKREKLA